MKPRCPVFLVGWQDSPSLPRGVWVVTRGVFPFRAFSRATATGSIPACPAASCPVPGTCFPSSANARSGAEVSMVGQDPIASPASAWHDRPAPGTADSRLLRFQRQPTILLPMQESHASAPGTANPAAAPLHDEIAQCAQNLWIEQGKPADRDLAIWLEAEQRLLSARPAPRGTDSGPTPPAGLPPEKRARGSARAKIRAGVSAVPDTSSPGPAERSIVTSLGGGTPRSPRA